MLEMPKALFEDARAGRDAGGDEAASAPAGASFDDAPGEGIVFADSLAALQASPAFKRLSMPLVHVLVRSGALCFSFQGRPCRAAAGDYVIAANFELAADFLEASGTELLCFGFAPSLAARLPLRSTYGATGHISLMRDPVMTMTPEAFERCLRQALALRESLARAQEGKSRFLDEQLLHLLAAHVLELFDIHEKGRGHEPVSRRVARILERFMALLEQGAYRRHRALSWYAQQLCVTPHYLSEVCRRVSGRGATALIDRFVVQEAVRLLGEKKASVSAAAEALNFSSVSYFTRYVVRHTGKTPSALRTRKKNA